MAGLGHWGKNLVRNFDELADLRWLCDLSPEVREEFESILRFWFDRGVDGFRIDVAHSLVKDPALPDVGIEEETLLNAVGGEGHPFWDRDGVHEVYRGRRKVADSYADPRVFVAEAWVSSPERLVRYLRSDELHTAFNFDYLGTPWDATALRATALPEPIRGRTPTAAPVLFEDAAPLAHAQRSRTRRTLMPTLSCIERTAPSTASSSRASSGGAGHRPSCASRTNWFRLLPTRESSSAVARSAKTSPPK